MSGLSIIHVLAAFIAFCIGLVIFALRKGDRRHRGAGCDRWTGYFAVGAAPIVPSRAAPAVLPGMVATLLCAGLLAVGCATETAQADAAPASAWPRTATPALPPDATYVVEKVAACAHFASGFVGDNSQRDREFTAAIVQLRCESIDEDVRGIVAKYAGNKEVLKALKVATQR